MGQWLVNQQDDQFGVSGLDELRQMASDSKLWPGDMIQPDGASDWIYAAEIPELTDVLKEPSDDDDFEFRKTENGMRYGLAGLFLLTSIIEFSVMTMFMTQLPSDEERLLGDDDILNYSEMLMTQDTPLRAKTLTNSPQVVNLQKDQVLNLMTKRDHFYKVPSNIWEKESGPTFGLP